MGWEGKIVPMSSRPIEIAELIVRLGSGVENFKLSTRTGTEEAATQALQIFIEANPVAAGASKRGGKPSDVLADLPSRPIVEMDVRGVILEDGTAQWQFHRVAGWGDCKAGEEAELMRRAEILVAAELLARIGEGSSG